MDGSGLSGGGRDSPCKKENGKRVEREGKLRGLLDQIAVLSYFIGEEFVRARVFVCVCVY